MAACNYKLEHIPISDEAQERYRKSLELAKKPKCLCGWGSGFILWLSETYGVCIDCNRKYEGQIGNTAVPAKAMFQNVLRINDRTDKNR